jgi:hypothetical protein
VGVVVKSYKIYNLSARALELPNVIGTTLRVQCGGESLWYEADLHESEWRDLKPAQIAQKFARLVNSMAELVEKTEQGEAVVK